MAPVDVGSEKCTAYVWISSAPRCLNNTATLAPLGGIKMRDSQTSHSHSRSSYMDCGTICGRRSASTPSLSMPSMHFAQPIPNPIHLCHWPSQDWTKDGLGASSALLCLDCEVKIDICANQQFARFSFRGCCVRSTSHYRKFWVSIIKKFVIANHSKHKIWHSCDTIKPSVSPLLE